MKVISVWQPFALMSVKGFKVYETRTWPAPKSIIGQRIGIASTKNIKAEQRAFCEDPEFQRYYERTGLAPWDSYPLGYLMGTVIIDSSNLMTEEFMEEVSNEEQAYGYWSVGNYAWGQVDPIEFEHPIPIQGKQGIYDWNGDLGGIEASDSARTAAQAARSESGGMDLPGERPDGSRNQNEGRRHLRLV